MSRAVPLPEPEVFGDREDGVVYTERLGVYALIVDENGQILTVEEGGLFLPGGGVEQGEAVDEALRRELLEEVGATPVDWRYLDVARQLTIDDETGDAWEKVERFFAVGVEPLDELPDEASWMSMREAAGSLAEEAQRWAVEHWGSTRP